MLVLDQGKGERRSTAKGLCEGHQPEGSRSKKSGQTATGQGASQGPCGMGGAHEDIRIQTDIGRCCAQMWHLCARWMARTIRLVKCTKNSKQWSLKLVLLSRNSCLLAPALFSRLCWAFSRVRFFHVPRDPCAGLQLPHPVVPPPYFGGGRCVVVSHSS